MNDRWIKASEIGEYLYCQRAGWYRLQGVASANVHELSAGSALHVRHGRGLRSVTALRFLAIALFCFAVLLVFVQILG